MPELPEVETVRIQLWKRLRGKTIKRIVVKTSKSVADDSSFSKRLVDKRFKNIDRIGKLLIFSFIGQRDMFLLGHLKMTGQFFLTDKDGKIVGGGGHETGSAIKELPDRHTRVYFELNDGSTLYFNDMRIFGYLKLVDKAGLEQAKSRFGPEPITKNFNHHSLFEQLQKSRRSIKAVLLDQTVLAGLGNIYVDEALFRAKVLPTRSANSLTKEEALHLSKAAGMVMRESIKKGGTTFQSFLDTSGQKGGFARHLKVFGREGQRCLVCGTIIEKSRVAGRGTHFCPVCQH